MVNELDRLIIFADYGLDDAAASVTIFSHEDRFSHIFIVPVGGNVPAEKSFDNFLTLLSYYQSLSDKITVVDTRHISQPSEYLASIHGKDGMGDLLIRQPFVEDINVITYEDFLETVNGAEELLSLGPMTLVKPLMEKYDTYNPVIMGGCVHTPPNFNGYEFNQSLDREAFAFCTKGNHAAITLDTCRVEKLDMRLYDIEGEDIHSLIVKADQKLSISRGEEGCYIWDDVAASYLLFPERFKINEEYDKDGNRLFNAEYISDKLYYSDED